MILPLLLLLAAPLAAQDVFSANDGAKSNPCQTANCGTFYYNPNDPNGLKRATEQCFAYTKKCAKGRGCDCWTMPDRPMDNPPIQLRVGTSTTPAYVPPPPRYTPSHYTSGPPPPGQKVSPADIGPGLQREVNSGRCQTAMHDQRDLFINCPGYVPDFVNDRLQKDPTAPDPANPAPIRLYGTITQDDSKPGSSTGNGRPSRFGVGNIDEADPPLLVTAKILQGIDDCLKENLTSEIAMLPLSYVAQKYRGLRTIMLGAGLVGNPATFVHDLNELRAPGQSLGDVSYEVGRLLCDGYSLKDLMNPAKNPLRETPNLTPVRPLPKPTPTHQDPAVKSALERGIPLVDHKALQAVAQENGWNIIVRDSNPYAMRWVGNPAAVPKPVDVKAKTLKPSDGIALKPYYGLASAKGISKEDFEILKLKKYTVGPPEEGSLIRTPDGKLLYSDLDLHGLYDKAGNDMWPKTPAGEQAMLEGLNGTTLERMFQHGPQDVYPRRNDPTGPSYGPQVPSTIYTHDGRNIFLDSISAMKSTYRELGIAWETIYPNH